MCRPAPVAVFIVLLLLVSTPTRAADSLCGSLWERWRGEGSAERSEFVSRRHHHHGWRFVDAAEDPPRPWRHRRATRETTVIPRMARRLATPASVLVEQRPRSHAAEPIRRAGAEPLPPPVTAVRAGAAILATPTAGAARPLGDVPVAPLE